MRRIRGFLVLLALVVVILTIFTAWKAGQGGGEEDATKEEIIREKTDDWTPMAP